jgi:hypothetical protein
MKSGLNDKTFVKILPNFIHTLLPDGVVDINNEQISR